jgi:transposase
VRECELHVDKWRKSTGLSPAQRIRGKVMKEAVRAVFAKVLELLIEEGFVKTENYFVDRTKESAKANVHNMVWAEKTKHY